MNGILILLFLVLASTLPGIIVFIWFRAKKSAVTLPWFLLSITAGIVSLLTAAFVQRFFSPKQDGLGDLFLGVFVRIALVEELGRLATFIPLSAAANHTQNTDISFGAALGLVSGLGFAILENALHGIANLNITLLRAFTAAPLHGACGIRVGVAVFIFSKNPGKAFFYFFSAVLIHGAYNLIIVSPALPSALAIIIALSALLASLPLLKTADMDRENSTSQTRFQP
jgi:RsiW-degrading membrane proteinase PrsW (M82 family)